MQLAGERVTIHIGVFRAHIEDAVRPAEGIADDGNCSPHMTATRDEYVRHRIHYLHRHCNTTSAQAVKRRRLFSLRILVEHKSLDPAALLANLLAPSVEHTFQDVLHFHLQTSTADCAESGPIRSQRQSSTGFSRNAAAGFDYRCHSHALATLQPLENPC